MYFRRVEERVLRIHVVPVSGRGVPEELVPCLSNIFGYICTALNGFNYVNPVYIYNNNSEDYDNICMRYPYYSSMDFCLLYQDPLGYTQFRVMGQDNAVWLGSKAFYCICSYF